MTKRWNRVLAGLHAGIGRAFCGGIPSDDCEEVARVILGADMNMRQSLREQHIGTRVTELQEEQLAIHQQATAAAAANKQVTIESLIAEAEAARAKAMS